MANKQKRSTVAEVEALVTPTLQALGFAVWDVRFEKEGPNWFLRILIDRADGQPMDTDACERASRAVDPLIDEADPIEQSYFLEVGSPGLGRRLTRPQHYAACEGQAVSARLIHAADGGARDLCGTLQRTAQGWAVATAAGEVPLEEANLAYLKLDDDRLDEIFKKA